MFRLLILFSTAISFQANAMVCATADKIKGMDPQKAIKMAYQSGPSAGNFAYEWEFDGLVYMSKDNAMGNMDILENYPEFNQALVDAHGDSHYSHDNDYSGIFQITYDQVRQCRRQVLLTGVSYDDTVKADVFTGWINVELCDPGLKGLFHAAAQYFESQGQKLDNILKLIAFAEGLKAQGQIDEDRLDNIKSNLDPAGALQELKWQSNNPNAELKPYVNNGDYGIYYVTGNNGHIIPRFSLRIERMDFRQNTEESCEMSIDPTVAYSGVLKPEVHMFSNSDQAIAYQTVSDQQEQVEKGEYLVYFWNEATQSEEETTSIDAWFSQDMSSYQGPNFYLSYINESGTHSQRPAVINRTLNNDPVYRIIDSKSNYLNIRTETNSSGGDSTVCGVFNNGDVIKVIGADRDTRWLQVEVTNQIKKLDGSTNTCTKSDKKHWISNSDSYSKPFSPFRMITANPDLNVRYESASSGDAMICGAYKKGEVIEVLSVDPINGWFQVKIENDLTKTDGSANTCNTANDSDNDGKFWMSGKDNFSTPTSSK